jgi:hypothetical protein
MMVQFLRLANEKIKDKLILSSLKHLEFDVQKYNEMQSNRPWDLHKAHANDKTVSMNGHTQSEQIREVFVIFFFYATVAMTKPRGMQVYIGYCKLILPTTDKLQGCLSHQQID